MEVAFSIAINDKRMDVAGLKTADTGAGMMNHLEFMVGLRPENKFLAPIRQYCMSDRTEADELREMLHKAVDAVFNAGIEAFKL